MAANIKKCAGSANQGAQSFFENDLSRVVGTLHIPGKGGVHLGTAIYRAIPALSYLSGAENQIPPTVIDSEIINCGNAYGNWREFVI